MVAFYCANNVEIIKKKEDWKPSLNESYLAINLENNSVDTAIWQDSEEDNLRLANNLVFPLGNETPNRVLDKINVILENERFEGQ